MATPPPHFTVTQELERFVRVYGVLWTEVRPKISDLKVPTLGGVGHFCVMWVSPWWAIPVADRKNDPAVHVHMEFGLRGVLQHGYV